MARYNLAPLFEADIPDVVAFLVRWHQHSGEDLASILPEDADAGNLERNLRWRLVENPCARPGAELGKCIRAEDGTILGLILVFPGRFQLGQRRLTGLCSAKFFVDQSVRTQGFLLFRAYLNTPGYDFWFGTSCNRNSAALWKLLGGAPTMDSDFECIIPVRLGTVAGAFAATRGYHPLAVTLSKTLGGLATPILNLRWRLGPKLRIERCHDWERLASLAEKHRNPEVLTAERSAEYLRWRYAGGPVPGRKEVYCFRDSDGEEGWFAVDMTLRGRTREIKTMMVLDLACSRKSVWKVIPAMIRLCLPRGDMLLMRGCHLSGVDLKRQGMLRRGLEAPECFLIAAKKEDAGLAARSGLVLADGDSAD